jgi:adenylate kinase family enzyme
MEKVSALVDKKTSMVEKPTLLKRRSDKDASTATSSSEGNEKINSNSSSAPSPSVSLYQEGSPEFKQQVAEASVQWTQDAIKKILPELEKGVPPPPLVIILRGVSGCGKSTLGKSIASAFAPEKVKICSADTFFMKLSVSDDGTTSESYQFNVEEIGLAHEACFKSFSSSMDAFKPCIIIDNTNTQEWEFKKYIDEVVTYNQTKSSDKQYEIRIAEIVIQDREVFERIQTRNVHSVPISAVQAQWNRWERIDAAKYSSSGAVLVSLHPFIPPLPAANTEQASNEKVGLAAWKDVSFSPPPSIPDEIASKSIIPLLSPETIDFISSIDLFKLSQCILYVGLFLTVDAKVQLLSSFPPMFTTVYADHVTVAFKPKVFELNLEVLGTIGTKTSLFVGSHHYNSSVQACAVQWERDMNEGLHNNDDSKLLVKHAISFFDQRRYISTNDIPHVTISTVKNVGPVFANDMLANSTNEINASTMLTSFFEIPVIFGICVVNKYGDKVYITDIKDLKQIMKDF